MEENPFTIQDLLAGRLTINLDMEWMPIYKLMGGLSVAIGVSKILTTASNK